MGCLNLLVIHYKELREKEHVVSVHWLSEG